MAYNFLSFKDEVKRAEDWLKNEYSRISTGRASPMVLDGVMVESYGGHMPVKNVASITIEDPKTLRVAPWDKSQIKAIEKALIAGNLGLSVATDDAGLRVIFPQLTSETRVTLVKILKGKLEDGRISIRKSRDDVWNDIQDKEKAGEMSEDEKFRSKEELQKIVDEGNQNLEAIFEKKEKEVLG